MDLMSTTINIISSGIIAAISGCISAKLSYSKEIKRSIYLEREKLYIEMFNLLEHLKESPYIMYDTEQFVYPLRNIKTKANLYASESVLEIITPFYERILNVWNKYVDMFDSEKAEMELQNRKTENTYNNASSSEQVELEFEREAEMYMKRHLLSDDEIADTLNKLSTKIRLELKTS